jgi:ABC-type transport system substrate-binding protein
MAGAATTDAGAVVGLDVDKAHHALLDFAPGALRRRPADGYAGGKIPKVERVEWTIISDPATATASLMSGQMDYLTTPVADNLPPFSRTPFYFVANAATEQLVRWVRSSISVSSITVSPASVCIS